MEKLSPEKKLAHFMKTLKRDWHLSTRQMSMMCGYSEIIIRRILNTCDMSRKHYDKIYQHLSAYVDDIQAEFIKCGLK